MIDFDICSGTGDIPTNDLEDNYNYSTCVEDSEKVKKYKDMGYIKDSTGRWYDPNNYIDTLYADW